MLKNWIGPVTITGHVVALVVAKAYGLLKREGDTRFQVRHRFLEQTKEQVFSIMEMIEEYRQLELIKDTTVTLWSNASHDVGLLTHTGLSANEVNSMIREIKKPR